MSKYHFSQVRTEIAYEIISLMKDGPGTPLKVDDILPIMAAPCTRLNFDEVEKEGKKLPMLMSSVRGFMKKWHHIYQYNKLELIRLLAEKWLPSLDVSTKFQMLKEDMLVDSISTDGTVLIREKIYNAYKKIFEGTSYTRVEYTSEDDFEGQGEKHLLGREEHKEYKLQVLDGGMCVDLDITEDEWYQILKVASDKVKQYLACIVQLGKKFSCTEIERKFGISAESANSRNSALGQLASRMCNIRVAQYSNPDGNSYWSIPILKSYGVNKDMEGLIWEARPELLAAARRILKEEHFDMPSPK